MNETLKRLIDELRGAGVQARWAVAACVALVLVVAGIGVVSARSPHFVVLASNLDDHGFNNAVTALANAGIRFETTMGPAPYVIRVEEGKIYEARTAIHLEGDFLGDARGIDSGSAGASSVLLGQAERRQIANKRQWQEVEMQLETLDYVAAANVKVAGEPTSPLMGLKRDERTASVTLRLRGLSMPTAMQTRALVAIVRGATGVLEERISIADQHSNMIFDGGDAQGADSLLALEERFGDEKTRTAQAMLDRTFGPGVSVVKVNGSWTQVMEESISQTLDPAKKPTSQRSRTTESSSESPPVGGPAGVASNTSDGGGSSGAPSAPNETQSTTEEETQYEFGSKTTHTIKQPNQLERVSISLAVDTSIEERLVDAEALVKAVVGFDEARGDVITTRSIPLHGLERDGDGAPVLPAPEAAPEPANESLTLILEYGLELAAGLAFLFVLLRALKGARPGKRAATPGEVLKDGTVVPAAAGGTGRPGDPDRHFEEEVDLDALARAHIEDLLREQPEKVSALLSRWALAEETYAETGTGR